MTPRSTAFSLILLGLMCASNGAIAQASNDNTVLILGPTVLGGASSLEASAAAALGYDVQVVTALQWSAMTASDFASYRAVVIGDPRCEYGTSRISSAIANNSTWGPEVDGNVVIIGTDPVYHALIYDSAEEQAGASSLIEKAMAFVLSVPNSAGKTGAYISLSCYYDGADVSVPLLDYVGDGGFSVEHTSCYNDAHIAAYHPALDGLTDADLSGWGCSIHSVFSSWDNTNFEVLAMGDGLGSSYTDDDGTVGSPYILARGVCTDLPSISVSLSPSTMWPPNNQLRNVEATVTTSGTGITVELVSITSDESGVEDDYAGATFDTDDRNFQLRAQRDGSGDGRVYTVTYRITDECGHEAEASATVTVPHDQGN